MLEGWDKIIDDYKTARSCLVAPKHRTWMREEDKGMYHLWPAYYSAKNINKKITYITHEFCH